MSRVAALVACGLSLAACSSLMPSTSWVPNLSLPRSAAPLEALRIESDPPGAEARTSQGQSCRTPCELTVQASGEISVTLSLAGYQPQTVSVQPEAVPEPSRDTEVPPAAPRLEPNPLYVELQPAPAAPAKKPAAPKKKKPVATAARPAPPPVSAPAPAPAPPAAASAPASEPAAAATNYPWPSR